MQELLSFFRVAEYVSDLFVDLEEVMVNKATKSSDFILNVASIVG